jgi:signal transduction histidine kinase
MKTNPTAGILGFSIGLVLVLVYAHQTFADSSPTSFVVLALAAWWTEYYAVCRKPSDFSCGFVFVLIMALQGQAAGALVTLVGSFFIRQLKSRFTLSWDLAWTLPTLFVLAFHQAEPSVATKGHQHVVWGAAAILMTGLVFYWGSRIVESRLPRSQESWRELTIEKEQRRLRFLVLPFAAIALTLDPAQGGMAALAAPLFLAVQSGVKNVGFRVEAQSAVLVAEEAEQSRRALVRVQDRLSRVSEKQKLLEDLVKVFDQSLTPAEAFRELHRTTRSAVAYRSIVLFQITGGSLQPIRQNTPEKDLLVKAKLALKTEPLAEKAWNHDKPYRGIASSDYEQRLLPGEPYLVTIPLKPFGVLYFGRSGEEPFSKVEASKLLYISQRAEGALIRAEETAHSQEALIQQTERSEALQKKVALTSHLLEASRQVMQAGSEEKVLEALKNAMMSSFPQHIGWAKIRLRNEPELRWGDRRFDLRESDELLKQVHQSGLPLYYGTLRETRFYAPHGGLESLLMAPLLTGDENLGVLVVGAAERDAFSKEMHDFVCTLACLAAGGLESLQLTLELRHAHDQVVQASKLSAIGQLAAGVAHELNTPLAAIGLALESAAMRPESAAETLESAEKALDRAQDIVKGLLEHSRQKDSDRELVVMSDVLRDLRETLDPQLRKRGQSLLVECPQSELGILANHSEIQQILANLVLNASDATPPEGRVTLRVWEDQNKVCLQVSDQGSGIPDSVKGRVFEPFFTTKPVGKGTGLGLSVCRELVQRHRGEIQFESQEGRGTAFTLRFPARLTQDRSILKHP